MPPTFDPNGKRILVTGATGFLGRPLVERLKGRAEIFALTREPARLDGAVPIRCDLNDPSAVAAAVDRARPDAVFHLAGRTPPGTPSEFYRSNTLATLHLLDVLRGLNRPVRIVATGSAAELGPVPENELPVDENRVAKPAEPYGLSKLLASTAVLAARPPIEPIVARIFNPIGRGMPTTQAFGRFASMLAAQGSDYVELKVGDLSPRRDFIDVRDVAGALLSLMTSGRPGTLYHVGTGSSVSIQEGLDHLLKFSTKRVVVTVDPAQAARPGPRDSRANIRLILAHTGWRPTIDWRSSLSELMAG